MTHKLSKLLPVGINPTAVLLLSVAGLLISSIYSVMHFNSAFLRELNSISHITSSGIRIFSDNKMMEPYGGAESFDIFKVFFICLALFSFYCFIYHFIGSKSIYTMRRLKNPTELYVRCLSVPLIFILLSIVLICLLNCIFIDIYLDLVPEENLIPGWDINLWEVL